MSLDAKLLVMPVSFSTTILLKSPASLTEAAIGQALRAIAPGFVKALEITSANAESYIVKLNDVPAVIMALPAPAPGFSDYKSDGPNLLWPSVEADLAQHKAHVIVNHFIGIVKCIAPKKKDNAFPDLNINCSECDCHEI